MIRIKRFKALAIGILVSVAGNAQNTKASSEILNDLHKLGNVGSVLYIAAHPDDENTRLIGYLTNHQNVDVSYLSLTRGDGGQNLIGTEIGEELGLIRTQELLAARRIDGGHQYFTRAVDFGYSKTPSETFNFWEKEAILSDVVWVIRQVRPDIIITRFSPDVNPDRPTHGHHTASAMLAVEALSAAADPKRFPEQLSEVEPWKVQKIFWNTSYWFYGSVEKMDRQVAKAPEQYLKIDVNPHLPLLGKSGSDISAESRSQHKSQGFGNAPVIKEQWEYLQTLDDQDAGEQLFSEINTNWKDRTGNTKLDKLIAKVIKSFRMDAPETSVSMLLDIRDEIDQIQDASIRVRKLEEVNNLLFACMGLKATAYSSARKVMVGGVVESTLQISCHLPEVNLKSVKGSGFNQRFDIKDVNLNTSFSQKLTWEVPQGTTGQPYWLLNDKSTGMYTVDNQRLIGKPEVDYPFNLLLELSFDGRPITLKLPLLHSHTDPVKGQIIQPLLVTPAMMVNIANEVYVFTQNKAKSIDVEVVSNHESESGFVELLLPKGWKVEPTFHKTAQFSQAGERQHFSFEVTPPAGQAEAKLRAIFKDSKNVYSMGIHELNYDHIPQLAVFPEAEAKVVKIDLKKEGNRVGYVMGAGDKVPTAMSEMGYQVDLITISDILQTTLDGYDAIVLGIRALNTLEDIGSTNAILTEYVKSGGNLVMQYNTSHRLKSQPLGPAKIKLSRDRVTEEVAEVEFLLPEHRVLNQPNTITQEDFEAWVQERGLYFPNEWDKEMNAVLGMHDQGEDMKKGSLLVGQFGEGYVVYTGLSFFRELPAGVSGAYRLLANILSL